MKLKKVLSPTEIKGITLPIIHNEKQYIEFMTKNGLFITKEQAKKFDIVLETPESPSIYFKSKKNGNFNALYKAEPKYVYLPSMPEGAEIKTANNEEVHDCKVLGYSFIEVRKGISSLKEILDAKEFREKETEEIKKELNIIKKEHGIICDELCLIEKITTQYFFLDEIEKVHWFNQYKNKPIGFVLDNKRKPIIVYDADFIKSSEKITIVDRKKLKNLITKSEAILHGIDISNTSPSNTYIFDEENYRLEETYLPNNPSILFIERHKKLYNAFSVAETYALLTLYNDEIVINEDMLSFWSRAYQVFCWDDFKEIGFSREKSDYNGKLQKTFYLDVPRISHLEMDNYLNDKNNYAFKVDLGLGKFFPDSDLSKTNDHFSKYNLTDLKLKIVGQNENSFLVDLGKSKNFNKYRLKFVTGSFSIPKF